MKYNKLRKINDKKVMHKVRKRWVVVSIALLGMLGIGATHGAHASTALQNTTPQKTNDNNQGDSRLQVVKQNNQPNDITNKASNLHNNIIRHAINQPQQQQVKIQPKQYEVGSQSQVSDKTNASQVERQTLVDINQEREKAGLKPFVETPFMHNLAEIRARQVVHDFHHSDSSGRGYAELDAEQMGLPRHDIFDENLGRYSGLQNGYEMANADNDGMMNHDRSDGNNNGHRDQILSTSDNYVGVGAFYNNGTCYIAEDFSYTIDTHLDIPSLASDIVDINPSSASDCKTAFSDELSLFEDNFMDNTSYNVTPKDIQNAERNNPSKNKGVMSQSKINQIEKRIASYGFKNFPSSKTIVGVYVPSYINPSNPVIPNKYDIIPVSDIPDINNTESPTYGLDKNSNNSYNGLISSDKSLPQYISDSNNTPSSGYVIDNSIPNTNSYMSEPVTSSAPSNSNDAPSNSSVSSNPSSAPSNSDNNQSDIVLPNGMHLVPLDKNDNNKKSNNGKNSSVPDSNNQPSNSANPVQSSPSNSAPSPSVSPSQSDKAPSNSSNVPNQKSNTPSNSADKPKVSRPKVKHQKYESMKQDEREREQTIKNATVPPTVKHENHKKSSGTKYESMKQDEREREQTIKNATVPPNLYKKRSSNTNSGNREYTSKSTPTSTYNHENTLGYTNNSQDSNNKLPQTNESNNKRIVTIMQNITFLLGVIGIAYQRKYRKRN